MNYDEISKQEVEKMRLRAKASAMVDVNLMDYYSDTMDKLNELFLEIEKLAMEHKDTIDYDAIMDRTASTLGDVHDMIESRKRKVRADILTKDKIKTIDTHKDIEKLNAFIEKEKTIVEKNMKEIYKEITIIKNEIK